MAHAIEYTDVDLVVLRMTRKDAALLEANLGEQWCGDHDHIYEALARRKKEEWHKE
jgi:hypothetical protein